MTTIETLLRKKRELLYKMGEYCMLSNITKDVGNHGGCHGGCHNDENNNI